jgi:hypothetical protein
MMTVVLMMMPTTMTTRETRAHKEKSYGYFHRLLLLPRHHFCLSSDEIG